MRVKFRILFLREGRPLKKQDLLNRKDPLSMGIRRILDFKYLEASKWLLLAEDSWEKYTLLALVNLSIGQEESAREFIYQAGNCQRVTDVVILLKSKEGHVTEVSRETDLLPLLRDVQKR